MSIVEITSEFWKNMTVVEREELLKKLKDAMSGGSSEWQETPREVFANTPDSNSLPGDLCGHLLISLTSAGFSAEKFTDWLKLLRRAQ